MLCIPATSTVAERRFSSAGITVSKRRSCLKVENVDKFSFKQKPATTLKFKDAEALL